MSNYIFNYVYITVFVKLLGDISIWQQICQLNEIKMLGSAKSIAMCIALCQFRFWKHLVNLWAPHKIGCKYQNVIKQINVDNINIDTFCIVFVYFVCQCNLRYLKQFAFRYINPILLRNELTLSHLYFEEFVYCKNVQFPVLNNSDMVFGKKHIEHYFCVIWCRPSGTRYDRLIHTPVFSLAYKWCLIISF